MASQAQREILDIDEQIARIEKTQAEVRKIVQETRLATPQMYFQGSLATAALIGAAVAVFKVFG